MSLPGETFPGEVQLSFFSLFAVVPPQQKADENWGPEPMVERFKSSYNRVSERNIGQKSMYCQI